MINIKKNPGSKLTILLASFLLNTSVIADVSKPNIVIIFADDMGYGDVQTLNPKR